MFSFLTCFPFKEKLSMILFMFQPQCGAPISFAHQIRVAGLDVFQDVCAPLDGEKLGGPLAGNGFSEGTSIPQ